MTIPAHHNVAIVTGAAGGLGAVISKRLAGEGYRVVMTDVDASGLEAASVEIDGEITTALMDVREPDSFRGVLEQVIEKWGGVGVLVNNAALTKTTPLFDISPEEFDAVTGIALKGTFIGCQVLGRHMRENGYGRIINMASLAGQNGGAATGAHYAASKGGIMTLTKVFARDLAADGVTVNAISPGPLDLDSVRSLLPPDKLEAVTKSIPAGVLGDPDYIAKLVLILADPAAVSAVGATYDVNGGLYLR